MKKLLLPILLLFSIATYAQEYVSHKQSFIEGNNTESTVTNQTRTITILGDRFKAELPDDNTIEGSLTLQSTDDNKKVYKTDKGCILIVNDDNIFLNMYKTHDIAYSFYLENHIEPTEEEKAAAKAEIERETEEYMYNVHVDLYGEFTANCMREGSVKPGMKREAVAAMLGTPEVINETETTNSIKEQWVYDDMYVYMEKGLVSAVQRRKEY